MLVTLPAFAVNGAAIGDVTCAVSAVAALM